MYDLSILKPSRGFGRQVKNTIPVSIRDAHKHLTYGDIARYTAGPHVEVVINTALVLTQFGYCTGYLIFLSHTVRNVHHPFRGFGSGGLNASFSSLSVAPLFFFGSFPIDPRCDGLGASVVGVCAVTSADSRRHCAASVCEIPWSVLDFGERFPLNWVYFCGCKLSPLPHASLLAFLSFFLAGRLRSTMEEESSLCRPVSISLWMGIV